MENILQTAGLFIAAAALIGILTVTLIKVFKLFNS